MAGASSGFWLVDGSGRLYQRVLRRAYFLQDCIQISESFLHRQRIHLASVLIRSGFDRRFQEAPGGLDCQRVCNHPARALLVLHPCWMRQSDPDGTPAHEKLDVDGVGMAGGYGDNQGLVHAVQLLSGPAVCGVKVLVHVYLKIYRSSPKPAMISRVHRIVCDRNHVQSCVIPSKWGPTKPVLAVWGRERGNPIANENQWVHDCDSNAKCLRPVSKVFIGVL